jgi:hypothetical protein
VLRCSWTLTDELATATETLERTFPADDTCAPADA